MLTTREIKETLLQHHIKKGYKVFKSFPIVSSDPSVMFINATITPFKDWFLSEGKGNYVVVQRCFRMGKTELDFVGPNPYYHTFFEMFGSGIFGINHIGALQYLIEILDLLGLEKRRMYFTVPDDTEFKQALTICGIEQSKIFVLTNNNLFWQEWRFGKEGLVGRGLTLVYSKSDNRVKSIDLLFSNAEQFIELLNLIHVYGQDTAGGTVIPIRNPGFDFGVSMERLTAVVQGCNNYEIDSIKPLVAIITKFLYDHNCFPGASTIRVLTDHLRAICILSSEGLTPSNKTQGYVLRKLIRRWLEIVWLSLNKIVLAEVLKLMIDGFCKQLNQHEKEQKISSSVIIDGIEKEALAFNKAAQKALIIAGKHPDISADVLWDTYGLSPKLLPVLKRKEDTT